MKSDVFRFSDHRPQYVTLIPVGNNLLLKNKTLVNNDAVLGLTETNLAKKTYRSKFIYPEGISFVSHKGIGDKDEIILQSEAEEKHSVKFVKASLSYYFRLDTNFKSLNHFYANSMADHYPIDSRYLNLPVLKSMLRNGRLFSAPHRRHKAEKTGSNAEVFRFM